MMDGWVGGQMDELTDGRTLACLLLFFLNLGSGPSRTDYGELASSPSLHLSPLTSCHFCLLEPKDS